MKTDEKLKEIIQLLCELINYIQMGLPDDKEWIVDRMASIATELYKLKQDS